MVFRPCLREDIRPPQFRTRTVHGQCSDNTWVHSDAKLISAISRFLSDFLRMPLTLAKYGCALCLISDKLLRVVVNFSSYIDCCSRFSLFCLSCSVSFIWVFVLPCSSSKAYSFSVSFFLQPLFPPFFRYPCSYLMPSSHSISPCSYVISPSYPIVKYPLCIYWPLLSLPYISYCLSPFISFPSISNLVWFKSPILFSLRISIAAHR